MSTTEPDPGQGGAPVPPPPPPSAAGPWASDSVARPAAPAEVEQPPTIRTAVRLMYVGAVLSAIGVLVTLTQIDAIRDQIEDDNPSLTPDELDTAVNIGVASAIVIGLVTIGLWIWMAATNGRGQSWARVVASVLGGLSIVSAFVGLATGTTALGVVFSLLNVALAAVILFLLYRPESSRFYEARGR